MATCLGAGCSEEENAEQQKGELEALQSIYSEEITILKEDEEYMVNISPRFDGNVQLVLPPDNTSVMQGISPPRLSEVAHLPSLVLYVRYHSEYPSQRPPDLHLSARWLDPKLVSQVVDKLRQQFTPECPIVFDWVTYLQDELVKDYSENQLQTPIIAATGCRGPLSDPFESPVAAVEGPGRHPCPIFLRSTSQFDDMEEFDKYESHKEFLESKHDCGICFQELNGREFCEPCRTCAQLFCKPCVTEYCQVCIAEGLISQLKCPYLSCSDILPDDVAESILSPRLFQRYTHLRNEVQLDSIPGMVFCPRTWCGSRIPSEPESDLAVCPHCGFPFCKLCRQTWHGAGPCPALQKVESEQAREEEERAMKAEATKKKQAEQDKRRIEELKTLVWMRAAENVRPCPKCQAIIQKSGGCNKMTCRSCGSYFCWLCGKVIAGYSHFDGVQCRLFRDEDYLPPTEVPNTKAPSDQVVLENALMSGCPRCGQVETKTGRRNWLQCRRCQFQFCHLCREPCFGLWHFNEAYGCKQLTTMTEDLAFAKKNKKWAKEASKPIL